MSRIIAGLVLIAASGCSYDFAPQDEEVGSETQAIVGGTEDPGEDAIVFLSMPEGACTGTLIGRRLVVTAAHCVPEGGGGGGTVAFGDAIGSFFATVPVQRSLPNRYFDIDQVTKFDIAFIRLAEDAPAEVTPYPINLDPLTSDDVGRSIRVVGYGVTDGPSQTGAGTRRQVTLPITSLTGDHIGFGTPLQNICQGDSGGPTFFLSSNKVLAVSSFGSNFCRDQSFVTRTDIYADTLVKEVVAAWGDGPCSLDGTCVTDGCGEFTDPDCDVCALDGICGKGCDRLDLDCPVTGFIGDLCSDNDGCETRICTEGLDDPRVKYCSRVCDPNDPDVPECPSEFDCVEGVCKYRDITPSAQGATCRDGSDCRSGMCDAEESICVEPCSSDSECGDPYSCVSLSGTKVCTFPRGGCLGCATIDGADGAGWSRQLGSMALLLLLAAFGFGAALRRRSRRAR